VDAPCHLSWSELPPFTSLPAAALEARLALPLKGTAEPLWPDGAQAPDRLEDSAADWLRSDPTMWPLLAFWPLLHQATLDIDAALGSALDRRPVAVGFLVSVTPDVRRLAARTVAAAHDGELGSALDETAMSERLAAAYRSRAAAEAFAAAHVPLDRLMRQVLALHTGAFTLMLERLAADARAWAPLAGSRGVPLRSVRATGDLHERGSVACLEFDDGARLLYKPRSLALEEGLERFAAWLEERAPGCAPRMPRSVDRGDYGWQEYVPWRPAAGDADIAAFYRRTGGLLAMAHLFRASDLHRENVLFDGSAPVVIDPECFFGVSFRTTGDGENEQVGPRACTVLHAGVLPEAIRRAGSREPLDVSVLGSVGERHRPIVRRRLRREADGTTRFEYVPVDEPRPEHVPVLAADPDVPCPVAGHEGEVLAGFTAAYRAVLNGREELAGVLEPLRGVRVRHIIRATSAYAGLLWELGHPEAAADPCKQEQIVNTLWPSDGHADPVQRAVFAHERRQLLLGRIPTFEHEAGATALLADGEPIPGAFVIGGFALVEERLARWSEDDLRQQVRLIGATLRLPLVPRGAKRALAYAPVRAEAPSPETLIRHATAIRDELAGRTERTRGLAWWLTGQDLGEGMYAVRPGTLSLYDGAAGIALFAGHLDLLTGARSRLAADAEQTMRGETERLLEWAKPGQLARGRVLGVFDGLWGCVYTAACLGWHDWARDVAEALSPCTEDLKEWDVISGTAGIAAVASELAARSGAGGEGGERGEDVYSRAARTALDHTCVLLDPVLRHQRIPTGFAHGMSGAAVAFQRGARSFPEAGYDTAAKIAMDAERQRGYGDDRGWHDGLLDGDALVQRTKREGWCRGAAGIGLARVIEPGLAEEGTGSGAEIELAARLTRERAIGTDHSLCHGALGALEFLDRVSDGGEVTGRLLGGIVRTGRWIPGLPPQVPDPGLMSGLAGIGYGLLRRAAPDRVPSVLTLELP